MPQTTGTLAGAVNEGILLGMYTWGRAANGRLGNGTTTPDVTTPTSIYSSEWKSVAQGNNFLAAVKFDGSLWTCGANNVYQLGQPNTTQLTSLTRVGTGNDWSIVSGGGGALAAIKRDGTLWTCGNNGSYRTAQGTNTGSTIGLTQVGSDSDWKFVLIGSTNLFAIKTNGDMYSCGANLAYVTAQGTATGTTTALTKVGSSTWTMVHTGERNASGGAVAAIGSDGKAYSWGSNSSYGTAQGTSSGTTNSPTLFNTDTTWTDICCCVYNGSGINDGKLFSWGSNQAYRTGQGVTAGYTTTETQIGSATTWSGRSIVQQQAGFAIQNGELYSWGTNANGRTGQGTASGSTTSPTKIGSATSWATTSSESAAGALIQSGLALR